MRRALRHLRRDEGGVAALEAALLIPFVLILGMGAIEFGWVMVQYQSVQTGLRSAARYASRAAISKDSGGNFVISTATQTAATAIVRNACQSVGVTSCVSTFTPGLADSTGTFNGGSKLYRIVASTTFTPASVGMLRLVRITLPRIALSYQVRYVGG